MLVVRGDAVSLQVGVPVLTIHGGHGILTAMVGGSGKYGNLWNVEIDFGPLGKQTYQYFETNLTADPYLVDVGAAVTFTHNGIDFCGQVSSRYVQYTGGKTYTVEYLGPTGFPSRAVLLENQIRPALQLSEIPGAPAATSTPRKEAPCRGCGRNNDIGVQVCWCCGGSP